MVGDFIGEWVNIYINVLYGPPRPVLEWYVLSFTRLISQEIIIENIILQI